MIGLRFKGISLSELRAAFGDGFAGFVIAMAIAMVGAAATSTVAVCPSHSLYLPLRRGVLKP
jgi:hypothetical protein